MLKKRRCPFIIAMNKVDRLHGWKEQKYTSIQRAFEIQDQHVHGEFDKRFNDICLQLNERGLNCCKYWENDDFGNSVSIVPTSALTGEGVPDLLYMILNFCQTIFPQKLEIEEDLQCTVIEVKNVEGLGTTIDVVLVNGTLRVGDQIVLAGLGEPIVTTIRALVTPMPMKDMRVKNEYVHHTSISTSMGVKICAPGLEHAVAGADLLVVGPDDDLEELKVEVEDSVSSILAEFPKQSEGVYVKASTSGSLEALLSFLHDMRIPVFDWSIGEVHKKDVNKALLMKEKNHPEYSLILAFDVQVSKEAKLQAEKNELPIFTADIIYHLFDRFIEYMKNIKKEQKVEAKDEAVFPVVIRMDNRHVFHKANPLIFAADVIDGQLRIGTPICVPDKGFLEIGRVASIEKDKKPLQSARKGQNVCVKLEQNTQQKSIMYGRHFDHNNMLYSKISRGSIDALKEHFRDEMNTETWSLIRAMKALFKIQ